MEQEKKYLAGWWVWLVILILASSIIFGIASYAGMFSKTIVERKIFENSFQYSEARKTELAAFKAQLAEINSKLSSPSIDDIYCCCCAVCLCTIFNDMAISSTPFAGG